MGLIDAFEIGYVTAEDGARLAYGTLGEGGPDILFLGTTGLSFEAGVDSPVNGIWWDILSGLGRVISVDLRGIGRSDPLPAGFSIEDRIDDIPTVLDAAGAGRVIAVGVLSGAALCLLLAARHPERVTSVVAAQGFARFRSADDYPYGIDDAQFQENLARFDQWGTGWWFGSQAPPDLLNPAFLRAAARLERLSGSPAGARALYEFQSELDIREVLGAVDIPVLIMNHLGGLERIEAPADLARRLPQATYVEHGPDRIEADRALRRDLNRFIAGVESGDPADRVLTTILVTDIVGSTATAARMGDAAWRRLLDEHDRIVREEVTAAGGTFVKSTGDGALATIPSPSRALRCAERLRRALQPVELTVRCGLHLGEVEMREGDIGGLGVHLASRVASVAGPGEVLVTRVLAGAVLGGPATFTSRGCHSLRGIPEEWELLALD